MPCFRDSLIVPIINCGTSFYAGFVIFSVLGFMATNKGTSVADVVASGKSVDFKAYYLLKILFYDRYVPLYVYQRLGIELHRFKVNVQDA